MVSGVRTSKPIAAISYNDPGYLRLKCEELRKAGRISEWYFIEHTPEEDEKKRHIHLYIQPSKMLQTDDLIREFAQPDPDKPGKVLTCPRWVSSRFADWYLYAIHDQAYLVSKGQIRRYHYRREDVQAYDEDALDESIREIDLTSVNVVKRMMDAQQSGVTFAQFFQRGGVPINAIRAYEAAWELLSASRTFRAGRMGHEDDETHTSRTDAPTSHTEATTIMKEQTETSTSGEPDVPIVDTATGEVYDELPF